jgi:hypothetical protein
MLRIFVEKIHEGSETAEKWEPDPKKIILDPQHSRVDYKKG